ncbi:lytic murein transglycosylase B [Aquisalimonas sp. 2447]|uniref:lytic murein transglycosylase B n=1 Tax=Aquisalimonas sp. 2447 TaxID=2740807 RepID=UPI001C2BDBFC|nr:lytic murein transglycosylase B [Aquisalimonas sp. 2447]
MPIRWSRCLPLALAFGLAAQPVAANPLEEQQEALSAFSTHMAEEHGLDRDQVNTLLADARHQQDIIDAITSPAEALPWHRYRRIFLQDDRIAEGAAFMDEHRELLDDIADDYGVDPAVLVAIVGVETRYGQHPGQHRVLDALVTLAFDYPPRADFFRSELEHFLLLVDEEDLDVSGIRGSYAGAMGIPQFISSSYRHYAVDGSGDGRRDLMNSVPDALASVANYFTEHRWREGEPVVAPARVDNTDRVDEFLDDGMRLNTTVGELRAAGIEPEGDFDDDAAALLLALDSDNETEYWVGLHNFRVITRYNHSPLYALAAYQLAGAIRNQDEHNQ